MDHIQDLQNIEGEVGKSLRVDWMSPADSRDRTTGEMIELKIPPKWSSGSSHRPPFSEGAVSATQKAGLTPTFYVHVIV